MAGRTILILGGGWGGLTAAHHLRGLLLDEHRVVVVERSATFNLYVSYLWLMTGERDGIDAISRDMAKLKRPGIEWVHAEARSIDPEGLSVETSAGTLEADYLVIALGAELDPAAVPGFEQAAHNFYDARGAIDLRDALEAFDGGEAVVLVAGAPFRCPAAPYEAAMLIEDRLRARAVRDLSEIAVYTPEPQPMAVTGPAVGDALVGMLHERGIDYHPLHSVTEIDPEAGIIHFGDELVPYDLLAGVPPHRAPPVLSEAGLTDETGYVPVHPQTLQILADTDTLEVGLQRVYAIGDVASVRLLNGMLLPKAGVFAEGEAQVVAAMIAADIEEGPSPRAYRGEGFCYIEIGDGLAAYGSGDFYAYPGPRVRLEPPSSEHRRAKEEYEVLLDTWFER